jgi:hypothetical protein
MLMQTLYDSRLTELAKTLDTTVDYLQSVRETHWAARLNDIKVQLETDPGAAINTLIGAFEGHKNLNRLYLSGPRNGHSLSERQEIEANGKLHVLRTHLYALANELAPSGA